MNKLNTGPSDKLNDSNNLNKLNILFIAHRMPYPPNKGDKIRSFNEIKYLSKKHNLYLAFLVDNKDDLAHLDELKKYCVDLDYDILRQPWQKIRVLPYLLTDKPLSLPYFYTKELQDAIDRRLEKTKIDAIICFSSPMAEYVFRSKALDVRSLNSFDRFALSNCSNNAHNPNNSDRLNISNIHVRPRLIMDFVDVDSDKWRMYAGFKSFPASSIYRREWKKLMNYEKSVGRTFDCNVFVSDKEVALFNTFCPDTNAVSIPNGVDFEYYGDVRDEDDVRGENVQDVRFIRNAKYESNKQCDRTNEVIDRVKRSNESVNSNSSNILFMGAMDYFPNEDAVLHFYSSIWPYIKKSLPTAKFYIVGGNPSKKIKILNEKDDRIIVTGYVPDVRPYLKMADVFIAPLRIARGVQNKVLDAIAHGVAVVARPEAVQGINGFNGTHGCIIIAEDNRKFAESVVNLIKNPSERLKAITASRKFIFENHNWEGNLKIFEDIMLRS